MRPQPNPYLNTNNLLSNFYNQQNEYKINNQNSNVYSYMQNNPSLTERINNAKLEQLRRAQNIKETGLNEKDLISYVINPIKIEKLDKKETNLLVEKYSNKLTGYEQIISQPSNIKINPPKELCDLWKERNNNPYKKVLFFLKNEDYTNQLQKSTQSDLIIHKTTQLEKAEDIKKLKTELKILKKLIFNHDNEITTLFSKENKKKFLEDFEYNNTYKNKINYDPKNCSELKEIYKNEQKKINKQNKRIDEMIELLITSEDLTKDELDEIQTYRDSDEKLTQLSQNYHSIKNDKNDMTLFFQREQSSIFP